VRWVGGGGGAAEMIVGRCWWGGGLFGRYSWYDGRSLLRRYWVGWGKL